MRGLGGLGFRVLSFRFTFTGEGCGLGGDYKPSGWVVCVVSWEVNSSRGKNLSFRHRRSVIAFGASGVKILGLQGLGLQGLRYLGSGFGASGVKIFGFRV